MTKPARDHAMFDAELSGAVLNLQLLNRIMRWLRPYKLRLLVSAILILITSFLVVISEIIISRVLVDYINQLRARGLAKSDAIVQACTIRFRPIMMTTMTTVLGLLPMALSTGEGAEIRGPMAITVIAGLLSGTLLTLFIIPVVYQFFGGRDKV